MPIFKFRIKLVKLSLLIFTIMHSYWKCFVEYMLFQEFDEVVWLFLFWNRVVVLRIVQDVKQILWWLHFVFVFVYLFRAVFLGQRFSSRV